MSNTTPIILVISYSFEWVSEESLENGANCASGPLVDGVTPYPIPDNLEPSMSRHMWLQENNGDVSYDVTDIMEEHDTERASLVLGLADMLENEGYIHDGGSFGVFRQDSDAWDLGTHEGERIIGETRAAHLGVREGWHPWESAVVLRRLNMGNQNHNMQHLLPVEEYRFAILDAWDLCPFVSGNCPVFARTIGKSGERYQIPECAVFVDWTLEQLRTKGEPMGPIIVALETVWDWRSVAFLPHMPTE